MALIFALIATPSFAAVDSACGPEWDTLAVLEGGRVKPLAIHARETMKFITGTTKPGGITATKVYCMISFATIFPNLFSPLEIVIPVKHEDNRIDFKLTDNQQGIEVSRLLPDLDKLENIAAKLESRDGLTPSTKELKRITTAARLYSEIASGDNWLIPTLSGDDNVIKRTTLREMTANSAAPEHLAAALWSANKTYRTQYGDKYLWELTFENAHLVHWAFLAALIALLVALSCSSLSHPALLTSLLAAVLLDTTVIIFRIVISGRAPMTNMYETVLGAGFIALVTAAVLSKLRSEKIFLLAGLTINMISLAMLLFSSSMLDPRIQALTPVLRDNFWLATHVTSVTASYAVFALSWLIANAYLIRSIFFRTNAETLRHSASLCYDCLKIGILFLAVGIILGAVWADYSWGRFWGWDPKETWSLITLFVYIGILHGRLSGWLKAERFLPATAAAFTSVLMTWFGVNYVLATGLHSYGFSEGGSLFLALIFAFQFTLLSVYAVVSHKIFQKGT